MDNKQRTVLLYLKSIKYLKQQKQVKMRLLEEAYAEQFSIKAVRFDSTKTSSNSKDRSPVENAIYKFMMKEIKLTAQIEKINKEIDLRSDLIETLDDDATKTLFMIRYLECKSWKDVMENLHMPSSTTFYLHNKGLSKLYKEYRHRSRWE